MGDKIRRIDLGNGRNVALRTVADGTGPTVVFCHPAPGSSDFDPDPSATMRRGIRLIAVDRPGYGDSDPMPPDGWATVSSGADDLAAVLRRERLGPVGVAGWSAGGRIALALAARHPDLVTRVVASATPAPNDDVPWIPAEEQAGIEAMRGASADVVTAEFAARMAPLAALDPASEAALELLGAGPGDADLMSDRAARERLRGMVASGFAQGAIGMAADVAGYTLRPWGFDAAEVQAKTLLLFGTRDPIGGSRHGRWWQRHLPDARLEMVPGAGHLAIMSMWDRALSFLVAGATRGSRSTATGR